MVTFICSYCDATLKKKQTEQHAMGRCRPASFICIDCHVTFKGNDYKSHVSCLTEFEKHWGEYAKPKQITQPKSKQQNQDKNLTQTKTGSIANQPEPIKAGNCLKEKRQEEKSQQTKKVKQAWKEEEWKGWKNEIKEVIKEHSNRIEVEQLKQEVLGKYKRAGCPLEEANLESIFTDKLAKLKKIKLVTYACLE